MQLYIDHRHLQDFIDNACKIPAIKKLKPIFFIVKRLVQLILTQHLGMFFSLYRKKNEALQISFSSSDITFYADQC